MSFFRTAERGGTVIVTLANPPYNTLHTGLLEAGAAILRQLAEACPAGGVVLTGDGTDFTRGMDTKIAAALAGAEVGRARAAVDGFAAALHRLPCALVGAANGHAIGAGGIMLLASDWVVAARGDYRIGLPEARAGLPFPPVPQAILDHWLDPVWRRRLALSSQLLGPAEAIAAGLVDEVVPPETLLTTAVERAQALMSQPGFAACKRQLRARANAEIDALLGD
jgi:enoyl-CoA hydratase/carnithine racemase